MRRLRILVVAATVLGTMTIAPHANAHWEQWATAYGYQTASTVDEFYLSARNDDRISYARISFDFWRAQNRPMGTYVVTLLEGNWLSDMDYGVTTDLESAAYGSMVAAQYRFRSGNEMKCTRWNFDPWNGYVQYRPDGAVARELCPETFANAPVTGTRPPSDLIIR